MNTYNMLCQMYLDEYSKPEPNTGILIALETIIRYAQSGIETLRAAGLTESQTCASATTLQHRAN